jgi:23S rRNA (pseudouridine1915-N3)-methyltransferase
MQVGIIAVGRMKDGPERTLAARYLDRATAGGRPLGLTGFGVTELAESRAANPRIRKTEEAAAILGAVPQGAVLVALDETGKATESQKFASALAGWRDDGRTAACFVIGGADGLGTEIREKADWVIAFSPLTWPHQLVRILLAEQLYRTTTILSGHPYHRI